MKRRRILRGLPGAIADSSNSGGYGISRRSEIAILVVIGIILLTIVVFLEVAFSPAFWPFVSTEKPVTWSTVLDVSGEGDKTPMISLSGIPNRLLYDIKRNSEDSRFWIQLIYADTSLKPIILDVRSDDPEKGEKKEIAPGGVYQLSIHSQNCTWRVKIQEKPTNISTSPK